MSDDTKDRQYNDRIGAVYQGEVEQLRFMKRQQWAITNYLVAIFAGILAVDEFVKHPPQWQNCTAIAIVVGATALAMALLAVIQSHMHGVRKRLARIYSEYYTSDERQLLDLSEQPTSIRRDLPFLLALFLVCIVGAAIVIYAVVHT